MTTLTPTRLVEQICDWRTDDVCIESDQRLVTNIALTGQQSRNGYRYSEHALTEAVALYDQKPVFLDHGSSPLRPQQRSTRDLVGSIVNPRFENGRIRGDVQTLDTEAGRTFLALAQSHTPAVGMSHVVLAERNSDRTLVEKIHEVISVDAVIFPATTSSFQEHHTPNEQQWPGSLETILSEIDQQLPAHWKTITDLPPGTVTKTATYPAQIILTIEQTDGSVEHYRLGWHYEQNRMHFDNELHPTSPGELQSTQSFAEQIHTLAQRCEELVREQNRQHEINELLTNSALPPSAITPVFREQLLAAADSQTRQQLLEDRLALCEADAKTVRRSPTSSARKTNANTVDDQAILSLFKRA